MRKGFVEDFFTDIIPAIIIIIFAILLLGKFDSADDIGFEIENDFQAISKIDVITALRLDVEPGLSLGEVFSGWKNQPLYFQEEGGIFVCTDALKKKVDVFFGESYAGWFFRGERGGNPVFHCDGLISFGELPATKSVTADIFLAYTDGGLHLEFRGEKR
ncbi:hypothetical protein HY501_03065 [Candidatus Woesearchaeota archaeon]|nr:hypothetical protein [Candidatus Woesearchaeota archaeon]